MIDDLTENFRSCASVLSFGFSVAFAMAALGDPLSLLENAPDGRGRALAGFQAVAGGFMAINPIILGALSIGALYLTVKLTNPDNNSSPKLA